MHCTKKLFAKGLPTLCSEHVCSPGGRSKIEIPLHTGHVNLAADMSCSGKPALDLRLQNKLSRSALPPLQPEQQQQQQLQWSSYSACSALERCKGQTKTWQLG